MEALRNATHENLIETALKVFQGLAVSPNNKKFINSRFGIELLVKFIRPDGQGTRKKNLQSYYAASAVRNLSDSAKQIQDPRRLAEMMLVPIQHQSIQVGFFNLKFDSTRLIASEHLWNNEKVTIAKLFAIKRLLPIL